MSFGGGEGNQHLPLVNSMNRKEKNLLNYLLGTIHPAVAR